MEAENSIGETSKDPIKIFDWKPHFMELVSMWKSKIEMSFALYKKCLAAWGICTSYIESN